MGVVSLCVLEALLIAGLLVQRSSRMQAERRFRQMVEAAPNGMIMVGKHGKIVLANAQMEKLFGYTLDQLLGQTVELLMPERFRPKHPSHRVEFFASPKTRLMGADRELFAQRKDGTEFPAEICLSPLRTDEGQYVLVSIIDVTERRRAQSALRESEGRFRRMADTAPVMVWMSGPDKLCTYANKYWIDFTGRPLERQIGNGWSEAVHPDDLQRCMDLYTRSFDARRPFRVEYRLRRRDGEYRWVLDTGVPRFRTDGAFEGYIGSAIDITDEKRLTEELRKNQRQLRVLTGKLLQAQETERRRIARELHDDLSQRLALVCVQLDLIGQRPPESSAQLAAQMQDLSEQVKQLSSAMHDLSRQLHPTKLEQLGLVAAVNGLCKEMSQSHSLLIEFVHHCGPEAIPADTALCLYRIVQEALRNVVKHSGARGVDVQLRGDSAAIRLRIADDGVGFDPKLLEGKGGLGLVSMRERLRLVGGEIAIDSCPSSGTRVEVRVPLPAAEAAESVWKVEKTTV
jgi:PAS domain S-box-containing protein